MSDDQRAQMLNIMAGSNPSAPAPAPATTSNGIPAANPAASIPASATPAVPPSLALSPSLSSLGIPSLHEIQSTQAELDALQRLQTQQADQIDALTHLLGPLSPSGRIPGLDEHGNPNTSYFDTVDYDQFIHPNAFSDPSFDATGLDGLGMPGSHADGTDFNFSLDEHGAPDFLHGTTGGDAAHSGDAGAGAGLQPGRVFETTSATNTPSPAGTEEITRAEFDSPERGTKRRRRA
jgi:heat shock transcription factor